MEILDHEKVRAALPDRAINAHKGDFGKSLLLCGSRGYTGAAAMAAMGALRSGAGLVYLGVPESIYVIEAVKLTEPIVFPLPDKDGMVAVEAAKMIEQRLPQMDAVLIGCGFGHSEGALCVLQSVMENATCPVVVDADGINLLAQHMDILRQRRYPTILTPHMGEFRRLGGNVDADRIETAVAFAREHGCIMCLKGYDTVITDGKETYLNPTGNPGMAVGGSGDVLAGMVAGLIGQRVEPLLATAIAAWLHGAAGDICAQTHGQFAMLPTDMLDALGRLMK